MHFDVIILGGGPGGAKAAQVLAKGGKKVALVSDNLGGECLNYGCIPTKTYLSATELFEKIKEFQGGLKISEAYLDWESMKQYKNKIVEKLKKKLEWSLTQSGATLINGHGEIGENGKSVTVGQETHTTDTLILATGSRARLLPNIEKSEKVVTNYEILDLPTVPQKLLVVGGGAIGVEFASIFAALGSSITIVEMGAHLLPLEDKEVGEELRRVFERKKITVLTETKASDEHFATNDIALIAVGRSTAHSDTLIKQLNLTTNEHGKITTTDFLQTNQQHIYVIGDLAGKALLAYTAEREGEIAAQHILGKTPKPINYGAVANTIFCSPEISSVGMSEEAAKAKFGENILVGKSPYSANSKALILGVRDGFAKIVANKNTRVILGIHIIGEKATELIAEASLAVANNLTIDEYNENLHSHPILGEVVKDACSQLI